MHVHVYSCVCALFVHGCMSVFMWLCACVFVCACVGICISSSCVVHNVYEFVHMYICHVHMFMCGCTSVCTSELCTCVFKCMCVYCVFMGEFMHTCTCMFLCAYMFMCILNNVFEYVHMYACVFIIIWLCAHVGMSMCVFVCVCVCEWVWAYMCVHMCENGSKAVRGQIKASESPRVVSFPTFQK